MSSVHDKNSTTVRNMTAKRSAQPWSLRALRVGMRGLGALSPALAARAMRRIWFTAPLTRPRPDARARLDAAQCSRIQVDGSSVTVWSWGSGPAVLLMHGWGGNAGQMHAFVAPLLAAGKRVIAFDAPAHGCSGPSHWGGRRVSFVEIAAAIRAVAIETGPWEGIVAHSGGCTAVTLALRDGLAVPGRIAFVSPFAKPYEAIAPFARAIGATARTRARFEADVQQRLGRSWNEFDVPDLPVTRQPGAVLVVHDREDREVAYGEGVAIARSWPGAELHSTQGLGHRRLLEDAAVVARVAAFVAA